MNIVYNLPTAKINSFKFPYFVGSIDLLISDNCDLWGIVYTSQMLTLKHMRI